MDQLQPPKVVPADRLLHEAKAWAREIGEKSPTAIEFLKRSFNVDTEHQAGLANRAASAPSLYLATDEGREGARAVAAKERIFVHGDYDADGVTSAALCLRALLGLGADVVGHVPRRSDGYDLQRAGVDRAKEAGASLILTADCGVCAVEAEDQPHRRS